MCPLHLHHWVTIGGPETLCLHTFTVLFYWSNTSHLYNFEWKDLVEGEVLTSGGSRFHVLVARHTNERRASSVRTCGVWSKRLSDPRVVLSDTCDLETISSDSFSDAFGDRRIWWIVNKSRSVRILSTLSHPSASKAGDICCVRFIPVIILAAKFSVFWTLCFCNLEQPPHAVKQYLIWGWTSPSIITFLVSNGSWWLSLASPTRCRNSAGQWQTRDVPSLGTSLQRQREFLRRMKAWLQLLRRGAPRLCWCWPVEISLRAGRFCGG